MTKKPFLIRLFTIFCVSLILAIGLNIAPITKITNAGELPTPAVRLTYANNAVTTDNSAFTASLNGTGIESSTAMDNAFHFTDKFSYVSVTANSNAAFTTAEEGLTITFKQTVTHTDGSYWEQLLAVEDASGNQAYVCLGGCYYLTSKGKHTYAQSPSGFKKLITTEVKDVAITFNADGNEILIYIDGELIQTLDQSHSTKASVIANCASLFLSVARTNGSSIGIRKPHPDKGEERNSDSLVLADFAFYPRALNRDEIVDVINGVGSEEVLPAVEKARLTYDNEEFSTTNGYTATVSGSGIVDSSTSMKNSFNISDIDSYVGITANADSTFTAKDRGLSIAFNLKSTLDTYYSGNTSLRPNVTDDFEQLFSVEGKNGEKAFICMGGLYYSDANGTVTYAQPNGAKGYKKLLTTIAKDVVILISADATEMLVFVDGAVVQTFNSTNSKAAVIENVLSLFLEVLQEKGSTVYVRKPLPAKSNRNSTTIMMADLAFYEGILTDEEIIELSKVDDKNPELPPAKTNVSVEGLNASEYSVSVNGAGFIPVQDSEHKDAYQIADIASYLTVTPSQEVALTKNGKGISFHFFHKSTTETYYNGNTALRPNVTDDFEQLFCAIGENGENAYICTGGIYYNDGGTDYEHAFPSANNKVLLKTQWKYVSIVVNTEEMKIELYVDGVLKQSFNQNNSKKEVVTKVVNVFAYAASTKGTPIYLRKPFSLKTNRNSATNVLDGLIVGEGGLTEAQVLAYYDKAVGNVRVNVVSSVAPNLPQLLGKVGDPITVGNLDNISGYVFNGLYLDQGYTIPLAENATFEEGLTTLYAKYDIINYSITYVLNGAVQNSANPTTYNALSNGLTIYPLEKAGHVFEGWFRTEDFKNEFSYIIPGFSGDITLYAKFTPITYKVNYVLNGGLLAGNAVLSYTVNDEDLTFVDAWKPYYVFQGWYLDSGCENKVETWDTATEGDLLLYAKFTPETFAINYVLNGGTIEGEYPESYTVESSNITLPVAYKENHTFNGWYLDEECTQEITVIDTSLLSDITIYAKFTEEEIIDETLLVKSFCSSSLGLTSSLFTAISAFAVAFIIKKRGASK